MRGKHRHTLKAIFADPIRANVPWADVETLFIAAERRFRKAEDRGCASA